MKCLETLVGNMTGALRAPLTAHEATEDVLAQAAASKGVGAAEELRKEHAQDTSATLFPTGQRMQQTC